MSDSRIIDIRSCNDSVVKQQGEQLSRVEGAKVFRKLFATLYGELRFTLRPMRTEIKRDTSTSAHWPVLKFPEQKGASSSWSRVHPDKSYTL